MKYLLGIDQGTSRDYLAGKWKTEDIYTPKMNEEARGKMRSQWN